MLFLLNPLVIRRLGIFFLQSNYIKKISFSIEYFVFKTNYNDIIKNSLKKKSKWKNQVLPRIKGVFRIK